MRNQIKHRFRENSFVDARTNGRHYETNGRHYETHGCHYKRLVAISDACTLLYTLW